ncbi:MAG: ferredoxin-thioredoxin reductase catalytic domain-containing protein [Promethearchaeota archaeon]
MNMETREGMIQYCKQVAKTNHWILNNDVQTFNDLINGLIENKKTLGYQSCPCRLACGKRDLDRDLICPCDYAPLDIEEFGACYCNLYMRPDFYETINQQYIKVPERRPLDKENVAFDYLNQQV